MEGGFHQSREAVTLFLYPYGLKQPPEIMLPRIKQHLNSIDRRELTSKSSKKLNFAAPICAQVKAGRHVSYNNDTETVASKLTGPVVPKTLAGHRLSD